MLTSKVIKELKPKEKRYQITDSDGLALRIQRSGVKSWVLRVPQNGRIVDITLAKLKPELPEPNLISMLLNAVHFMEAQTPYSPRDFTAFY